MTTRAGGIRPVLRHTLAHRENLAACSVVFQRRNVRWRWRRRRAENVAQDPLAAKDRRRPIRVGSHGQNASMAKQTAANAAAAESYSPEVTPVHIGNSIVS